MDETRDDGARNRAWGRQHSKCKQVASIGDQGRLYVSEPNCADEESLNMTPYQYYSVKNWIVSDEDAEWREIHDRNSARQKTSVEDNAMLDFNWSLPTFLAFLYIVHLSQTQRDHIQLV